MGREEKYITVAVCPWCRSSVTDLSPIRKVICKDCGCKYCLIFKVPEGRIGMKDKNI